MPEPQAKDAPTPRLATPNLPIIDIEPVPACELCKGVKATRIASGYDYELETCGNLWWFVECDACKHVWLHPRPAASALPIIYPTHYYAYNYDQRVGVIARFGKALLDNLKLTGIVSKLGFQPRRYLDVGCGNGRFLSAMERRGVPASDLYGLELDRTMVDKLVSKGYRVACERVETSTLIEPASLDLITMFHVIEHVDAPVQVVRRLAEWLAPGGMLALETPNLDSWDARLFRSHFWGGYHIPRHWHLFTPETMTSLLTQAGLSVESVKCVPGHSFWLYSIHHHLKYGPRPWPWLAAQFDPFRGLVPLMVATAFDLLRAKFGYRTSSMLILAKKPGGSSG